MKQERYIGVIDWFGTSDGRQFGFIEYEINGKNNSIFIHRNQIIQSTINNLDKFKEGVLVTFYIRESQNKKNRFEAYDVLLLENEKEYDLLIQKLFKTLNSESNTEIRKGLLNHFKENTKKYENNQVVMQEIKEFLNTTINISTIDDLLSMFLSYFTVNEELSDSLIQCVIKNIENKNFMLKKILPIIIKFFGKSSAIYQEIIAQIIELIEMDKIQLIDFNESCFLINIIQESKLDKYFSLCLDKLSFDILIDLWLKESHIAFFPNDCNFNKEEYSVILAKIITKSEFIIFLNTNIKVKEFFRFINKRNLQSEINKILNLINDITKLKLWLDDIIEYFDFNSYSQLINQLTSDEQQLFIKKLFYLIYQNKLDKKFIEIIFQLNITDYSTKVVSHLIQIILTNQNINSNSLKYDLLKTISDINLVNFANDILQLKGYFNYCKGRIIEKNREINTPYNSNFYQGEYLGDGQAINDKQYFYLRTNPEIVNNKPIVCEGQLSTKNSNLNFSTGQRCFFWCRNKQCFESSRHYSQNVNDWKNYTLIDLLAIIGVDCHNPKTDNDIGLLYGVINHVNKFLERLNCKGCGKLLKPNGNSNYTYYRVKHFSCDNPNCTAPDKDVYLSHCSNGRCDGVIDSRESARCENNFVICTECFACCSQKILDNRNNNRLINGDDINKWRGHRGITILCPSCANPLQYDDAIDKQKKAQDVINYLENLFNDGTPKDINLVSNMGFYQNSGQKWFVFHQRQLPREEFLNLLHYWQGLGFDISDFPEDSSKYHYRLIQPVDGKLTQTTVFKCNNCNHTFDYTNDKQRVSAIQYWHFSPTNKI